VNDRTDTDEQVRRQALEASRQADMMDEPLVAPHRGRDDREVVERGEIRGEPGAAAGAEPEAPLFSPEETDQLRTRWESVQTGFVDEPRRAVEEADGLVRQVMDRLTEGFSDQRERLESEWGARDEVSTEDLRMALRHYRSFFDRLLRL
jgi:hypothetical protein